MENQRNRSPVKFSEYTESLGRDIIVLTSNIWRIWGSKPVDPIVFDILSLQCETSLKVMLLVVESAWKSTCHSTKILYPGIETKIFCYLERFSFILSMFSNAAFSRKKTVISNTHFCVLTMTYEVYQTCWISVFGFLIFRIFRFWWYLIHDHA